MGIRQMLDTNRVVAIPVLTVVGLVCALVIYMELRGPVVGAAPFVPDSKVFYSDDDGRTWFLDDASKGSPFDRDGKHVYRAIVFRCSGGQPFVAYLGKYSEAQKALMPGAASASLFPPQDLKKPGSADWFKNVKESATGYPPIKCGDGAAELVSPSDPNSGTKS